MRTECTNAIGQAVPIVMGSREISRYGDTSKPSISILGPLSALTQDAIDGLTALTICEPTGERLVTISFNCWNVT